MAGGELRQKSNLEKIVDQSHQKTIARCELFSTNVTTDTGPVNLMNLYVNLAVAASRSY